MKLQEVIFLTPVKVFQIFRNVNVYGKKHKSFDDRKGQLTWTDVSSKAGYIENGELYLPETILENPDLKACDLITIEDDIHPQIFSTRDLKHQNVISSNFKPPYNNCFHLTRSNRLDIFEIRKTNNIELFLNYGYFDIGLPKRDNFKLCDIKLSEPVEIKINGKTDHSMSRGRERIFKEQHYIFDYIGEFDRCKILKEPYGPTNKSMPVERKVIDLIKELW